MRALRVIIPLLVLSGCWNFQKEFDRRCASTLEGGDAGFTDALQCDGVALGGGAGGGGGTDGGGAGGGSGGGTTGGGGGAACSSRADSGCFGAGEWCWELPNEIPSNELYVAFTTPDAGGVWAAGAGPTLVYWENGNITNKTHLLLIDDSADPYAEPAAVTSVAAVDDGVFLAGPRMDLLQKSPADPFFRSNGGGQWDALGADSRGRLFGVSKADRGILQRFDTTGVTPHEFRFTNTEPVYALAFDLADTAYVTTGEHALRLDLSVEDGGTVDVGAPLAKQSNEFLGPVTRIPDGGVLVGGNVLYENNGMDWVNGLPMLQFGGGAVTSMVVSGTTFWIFGDQGNVFNATAPLSGMALPTNALGATAAPGGEAWVVGAHGMIARVKSGGSQTLAAPLRGNDIRALYVTDTVAYAAQNEGVLSRNRSTWTENPRLSGSVNGHQWIAVAAVSAADGGQVVWAIDQQGGLYKDDATRSSGELMLQLEPPFIPYYPRSAATFPLPDGGALLGYGKVILRLTGAGPLNYDGGTIFEGVLPDGGTPPELFTAPVDMISGLAETNQALVVTGHMNLAKTSRLYAFKSGSWSAALVETPINGLIEDVAACPSGAFLAAGNHALLKRLDASGSAVSEVLMGQMPSGVDFASVWCGPNDEAWVLSRSGDVLRYGASGMPTRERTGWGRRDNSIDPIDASAIRGNSSVLFISGGSSAVISRPLCP